MKTRLVTIILLLMCMLAAGCGTKEASGPSSGPGKQKTSSADSNSAEIPAEASGTYVGLNGTSIVVYPDGKADYFFIPIGKIESGDKAVYEDGIVTISSKAAGCDMFFETKDKDGYYDLKADIAEWDPEKLVKVSDASEKLGAREATQLIVDTIRKEPAKTVMVGNVVFSVPSYFYNSHGTFYTTCFADAVLSFSEDSVTITSNEFFSFQSDMSDNIRSNILPGLGITEIDYKGCRLDRDQYLPKMIFTFTGKSGKNPITVTAAAVKEAQGAGLATAIFLHDTKACKGEFDCQEDIDKMIKTAELSYTPKEETADSDTSKDITEKDENETSAASTGNLSAQTSGISPEFKKMMDEYEAFFDEYIALMNSMKKNPSDLALLAKYASFLEQYTETMESLEALESQDMTDEEALYYAEVMLRIDQKLLKAAQ